MFEAIGLTVISDPAEVARYRQMPMIRSSYTFGEYWGHLSPLSGAGWQWVVNHNKNESKTWNAEGQGGTPEAAQADMTKALRSLTQNPTATWVQEGSL